MSETVRKGLGRNQEETLPIESLGGKRQKKKERMQVRERLALRKKVIEGDHLDMIGGVDIRDRNKKRVCATPWTTQKTLKLRFRVGDLDLPEKKKKVCQ